jgi:hypothetical protein
MGEDPGFRRFKLLGEWLRLYDLWNDPVARSSDMVNPAVLGASANPRFVDDQTPIGMHCEEET